MFLLEDFLLPYPIEVDTARCYASLQMRSMPEHNLGDSGAELVGARGNKSGNEIKALAGLTSKAVNVLTNRLLPDHLLSALPMLSLVLFQNFAIDSSLFSIKETSIGRTVLEMVWYELWFHRGFFRLR